MCMKNIFIVFKVYCILYKIESLSLKIFKLDNAQETLDFVQNDIVKTFNEVNLLKIVLQ